MTIQTMTMSERGRHRAEPREERLASMTSLKRGQAPAPTALDRRARALGWFSLGLGLAELLAPAALTRAIGAPLGGLAGRRSRKVAGVRALGAREIAAGLGILSGKPGPGWLWARVLGDVMDLAVLGDALASRSSQKHRAKLALAIASVAAITVVDAITARQLGQRAATPKGTEGDAPPELARGIRVRKSITVNRPPAEVYRFWHDLGNLPRFMAHLESVTTEGSRSRWSAKGPAGTTVHWEATITAEVPDELLAWQSVDGSEVSNAGAVRFARAPGGQGTEVHVDLTYDPPAGKLGALVAKLFGEEPSEQIKGDLYRFKQVIETGEVLHSDASVHRGPHPAQPARTEPGVKR